MQSDQLPDPGVEGDPKEAVAAVIRRVPGLMDSLSGLVSPYRNSEDYGTVDLPLAHEQIIQVLANDPTIEQAVLQYLSPGGGGWRIDDEGYAATNLRFSLQCDLTKELRKRLAATEVSVKPGLSNLRNETHAAVADSTQKILE